MVGRRWNLGADGEESETRQGEWERREVEAKEVKGGLAKFLEQGSPCIEKPPKIPLPYLIWQTPNVQIISRILGFNKILTPRRNKLTIVKNIFRFDMLVRVTIFLGDPITTR